MTPGPGPVPAARPAAAPRRRARRGLPLLLALLLLGAAVACTDEAPAPVTLRLLAAPELADMGPFLDDFRRETGIRIETEYRGAADADRELARGDRRHDIAWLASDRSFQLRLRAAGRRAEPPLTTGIMRSPVVIGMKPATAARLRAAGRDRQISWADAADAAAGGSLSFAMADPRHTTSGLAALVGVATAAAGTGGVLRPGDVSCDRLSGFFSGHALTEDSPARLADAFAARQDTLDALITHESELLALNASGKLRTPLEIVHPKDGMVLSDHPLLLLDPARRAPYDRLVEWLKSEPVQRKIMERTLRRPIDPALERIPGLREPIGNALYFPDRPQVVDRLLADYGDPRRRRTAHVLFLLDYSGSMRGERIERLRAAFDGLGGADDSRSGKFLRFHRGEKITVLRFGGRVLDERTVTYRDGRDLERLRDLVASEDFDDATAIWSGLDHAYRTAGRILRDHPGERLSIVLMTDGRNNAGIGLDAFLRRHRDRSAGAREIRTHTVRYGEADAAELGRAARATGGRLADAADRPVLDAFKEIRGCVD
ncbi:substrate-binding domain-containing protein [Streptomyces sp. NPDC014894]|uniref:vWA domain-containing protein n=1 Tax=Streptomyces sp. NPDC014894 TaxID=3364931 RepID=UPI0036F81191